MNRGVATSPRPKPGWNQEKEGVGVPHCNPCEVWQKCNTCNKQCDTATHTTHVVGRPRLRCAALPAPFSSSNWYDGGRDFRCSMNTDRPELRITTSESDAVDGARSRHRSAIE
jgi:hypothetical protein